MVAAVVGKWAMSIYIFCRRWTTEMAGEMSFLPFSPPPPPVFPILFSQDSYFCSSYHIYPLVYIHCAFDLSPFVGSLFCISLFLLMTWNLREIPCKLQLFFPPNCFLPFHGSPPLLIFAVRLALGLVSVRRRRVISIGKLIYSKGRFSVSNENLRSLDPGKIVSASIQLTKIHTFDWGKWYLTTHERQIYLAQIKTWWRKRRNGENVAQASGKDLGRNEEG